MKYFYTSLFIIAMLCAITIFRPSYDKDTNFSIAQDGDVQFIDEEQYYVYLMSIREEVLDNWKKNKNHHNFDLYIENVYNMMLNFAEINKIRPHYTTEKYKSMLGGAQFSDDRHDDDDLISKVAYILLLIDFICENKIKLNRHMHIQMKKLDDPYLRKLVPENRDIILQRDLYATTTILPLQLSLPKNKLEKFHSIESSLIRNNTKNYISDNLGHEFGDVDVISKSTALSEARQNWSVIAPLRYADISHNIDRTFTDKKMMPSRGILISPFYGLQFDIMKSDRKPSTPD